MKRTLLPLLLAVFLGAGPARAVDTSFERDPSLPLVYINVAVRAGTVTDPPRQSGVTNFMGEMLMRGTRSRTKEQIDLELDQMGAQLEVEARAEALIFRGAVLSSQLDRYLRLLRSIIIQPSFPANEMRKLKAEIRAGIRQELDNDSSLGARAHARFLFGSHPYGNPILGTEPDIARLTREQVMRHYDRLVRNRTLVVLGSGDADPKRIAAWANGLGKARPGGVEAAKVAPPAQPQTRRLLIVDKPDRTQTQIFGGQIGKRLTDDDYFPLYVGNHAFGGGSFSSRLMQEVRVKRGWSYGASSAFRHGLEPRSWTYHLFPASKYTPEALALTLSMIEDLKNGGIRADELEFARRSLVNGAGFLFNTPRKRVENRLLELTLDLPEGFFRAYGPRIAQVTRDQVNEALRKFLLPGQLTLTVVGTANGTMRSALERDLTVAKDKDPAAAAKIEEMLKTGQDLDLTLKERLAKAAGVPLAEVQVQDYRAE
jgi:zinc protease